MIAVLLFVCGCRTGSYTYTPERSRPLAERLRKADEQYQRAFDRYEYGAPRECPIPQQEQ